MSQRPPNDPTPIDPRKPFESENVWAAEKAVAQQQHEQADANMLQLGGVAGAKTAKPLPQQPADLPVINSKPFRNLRGQ